MKKPTFVSLAVFAVAFIVAALSSHAMPISSSNMGIEYLVRGKDLSKLSLGLYGLQGEREITWNASGVTQTLESSKVLGYVGYDLLHWVTVYAVGGSTESKFGNADAADAETEYGIGFRANILNHFIREPMLMEDVLRVNLSCQYTRSEADVGGADLDWEEISVAATVGIVNHSDNDKLFAPESISLYVGPLYSTFESDDFEAEDEIGAVAGMEIFFMMDTIILDLKVQHFEETSVGGGINFRF